MKFAAPFLFAILFIGCGQRPLEPRDATPGVPNFTIATFNILDEQASDPATMDAVGRLGTDIVALQEVTDKAEPVLRERYSQTYPYMVFHPSGSAGIGVMSKFPMVEREFIPAPNGWHPALHVSVNTPAGWLEVLEVHLHAPSVSVTTAYSALRDAPAQHRAEIELFVSSCANKPMIVLGDFNEDTSGAAVSYLEERGFVNILPLFKPGQFTWKGRSPGGQFEQTLDHIMFNGVEMSPLNAWVSGAGVSDHIPVLAHLEAGKQPW